MAPGVIKTPLWTDNPEKLRLVKEGEDKWVTPEYVAETMVDLVEGEEIEVEGAGGGGGAASGGASGDSRKAVRRVKVEGGMIVEIAKGKRRVVEQFNDPGPSGDGNTVSGMGIAEEEIFGSLKGGWGKF